MKNTEGHLIITEAMYKRMPTRLQAMFDKLPNPGSDEVVGLFPVVRPSWPNPRNRTTPIYGGNALLSSKTKHYNPSEYSDSGSAARFFYCAKASRKERGEGNNHPTIKPLSLMRYLCRLTKTPTGGTVLDLFMGSGTTLLAAGEEERRAVGIEISEEYCQIAVDRLRQRSMF